MAVGLKSLLFSSREMTEFVELFTAFCVRLNFSFPLYSLDSAQLIIPKRHVCRPFPFLTLLMPFSQIPVHCTIYQPQF